MTQVNVIALYARLSIIAERCRAAGQLVPEEVFRTMQGIETRARAQLNPQQFQAALYHVEQEKTRLLSEDFSARAQESLDARAAATEQLTRNLTKGLLGEADGLTPEQFVALRDGKSVKLPARNPKPSRESLDEASRRFTRQFDPSGKGFDTKRGRAFLDSLTDGTPAELQKIAERTKVPVARLKEVGKEWATERLRGGLTERRAAYDKDVTITPERSDSDRRRAQIIDAMAQRADPREFAAEVSESGNAYVEESGRRGDIARAFEYCEENSDGRTE